MTIQTLRALKLTVQLFSRGFVTSDIYLLSVSVRYARTRRVCMRAGRGVQASIIPGDLSWVSITCGHTEPIEDPFSSSLRWPYEGKGTYVSPDPLLKSSYARALFTCACMWEGQIIYMCCCIPFYIFSDLLCLKAAVPGSIGKGTKRFLRLNEVFNVSLCASFTIFALSDNYS
jgi:hypothetical protein